MTISELYDVNSILIDIEAALQIDGKDYGERDVDKIMDNIYTRIIRQRGIDLKGRKITDDTLYVGKSRGPAVLFVENITQLHAMLCGYLQVVRYIMHVTIRPININYMGFTKSSFMSFLANASNHSHLKDISGAMRAIKGKFSSVNNCLEKKLILILIVAYELGFSELMASVAEVL